MSVELLERAAERGAVLLRAEVSPGRPELVATLLLTFDLGRVLVRSNPRGGELRTEHLEPGAAPPVALENASEDEPWWRVLGNPLTRVQADGPATPGGVRLQFRSDTQSPRLITLEPRGASVSVRLENPPEPL